MKKLGFIGMGNMASAIARGINQSQYINGYDMMAYDINPDQLEKVKDIHVEAAKSALDVVKNSEYIIVAVKPQVLEGVVLPLKEALKNKVLISIALGYDFERYESLLDNSTRHVFVMPNTPVQVLEGMCLIEERNSLTEEELRFVKELFLSIGKVEVMPSHLMKVAGTLSGCTPAFMYMVIEALADGAVKEGLPRNIAYKLASQVMLGSGKMQRDTEIHPGILKDNVCSPGGSTIKGVEALEEGKMRSLFIKAISASTNYDK